jgi:hypothetical protein
MVVSFPPASASYISGSVVQTIIDGDRASSMRQSYLMLPLNPLRQRVRPVEAATRNIIVALAEFDMGNCRVLYSLLRMADLIYL